MERRVTSSSQKWTESWKWYCITVPGKTLSLSDVNSLICKQGVSQPTVSFSEAFQSSSGLAGLPAGFLLMSLAQWSALSQGPGPGVVRWSAPQRAEQFSASCAVPNLLWIPHVMEALPWATKCIWVGCVSHWDHRIVFPRSDLSRTASTALCPKEGFAFLDSLEES